MRIANFLIVLFVGISCFAQSKQNDTKHREPYIVSTAWLGEHLHDPSLVLIQIGKKEEYDAEHIPGARFLTLSDVSTPRGTGLSLELPSIEKLDSVFESLGISDNSRIVVYFGNDWVSPTTRMFFTLEYVGLGGRTSILNGGLPVWKLEKRLVTAEVPKVSRGNFTPHPKSGMVVNAEWVNENLNKPLVAIIDARSPVYYDGTDAGGMPRAGHIPGAVNVPYDSLVHDNNEFKSPKELQEIFKKAGVKPGTKIVAYCHIGQQATLVYFTSKCLGYNVSLYDGSFQDWSARKELPIEVPKARNEK